ncbi:MAG: metal-dependent transcriptional regulator [Vicingaceae bacterium]
MPSQTKENYLKALFNLMNEKGEISLTELSESLVVSKPTANNMIRNLKELGWVSYQKYKPLKLTKAGQKQAALIIRKHRITEMYLVKKLGIGWEKVHAIAEEMEHIKSPLLFERMDQVLGFPDFDPHGSPIPDKNGVIKKVEFHLLSELELGESGIIIGIENSTEDFLKFLNQKKIKLGDRVEVVEKIEFDESVIVNIDSNEMQFSKKVADCLRLK